MKPNTILLYALFLFCLLYLTGCDNPRYRVTVSANKNCDTLYWVEKFHKHGDWWFPVNIFKPYYSYAVAESVAIALDSIDSIRDRKENLGEYKDIKTVEIPPRN